MKNPSLVILIYFVCLSLKFQAQISFVLTNSLCAGDSVQLVANINTYPATTFSWSSNPSGAVFVSPSASSTRVIFPVSGTYAIVLMASAGNSTAYATNSILVQPKPQIIVSSPSDGTICPGQTTTLNAIGALTYSWVPVPGFILSFGGIAQVAPGVTTVFSVSGTNAYGCYHDTTYTLEFGAFPNLSVLSTASAVCSGNQTTLTAYGASTFTWTGTALPGSVHQNTVSVGAGTYSVVASNGGSCVDSTTYIISLLAPLNLIVHSDRTLICKDSGDTLVPVSLTGSGATTYVWEPFNPSYMTYSIGPSTAVSPTVSTCYTLSGFATACTATTSVCINVEACTDLKENGSLQAFTIFPNPVKDVLSIRSDESEVLDLELKDLFGTCVRKQELDFRVSALNTIDLSDLHQGLYILTISKNKMIVGTERILEE